MQRPRAPGEAVIRAPPALDLSTLPQNDPQTKQLFIVQSIISQAWPALLAALSFIIATNLSDELFVEVLASLLIIYNPYGKSDPQLLLEKKQSMCQDSGIAAMTRIA